MCSALCWPPIPRFLPLALPALCCAAGVVALSQYDGLQRQLLSVAGLRHTHEGSGAPLVATAAAMRAGAGRPNAPRCVVSTAFTLLNTAAQQAGLGIGFDVWVCSCQVTKQDPSVSARFHSLACGLRPILQCVLGAVAAGLSAELRAGGPPAAAAGRVFSRSVSPVDVAAALSASLTSLYGVISLHLHRLPGYQGLPHMMDAGWVRLLSACADILNGLGVWLMDGQGSTGGGVGSGDAGGRSSSSGSSGSSSSSGGCGDGSSGSSSSSLGQVRERWRAALQEYAVINSAARVGPMCLLEMCTAELSKTLRVCCFCYRYRSYVSYRMVPVP